MFDQNPIDDEPADKAEYEKWALGQVIERLEASLAELIAAIEETARDRSNGMDVLASASWDNVVRLARKAAAEAGRGEGK